MLNGNKHMDLLKRIAAGDENALMQLHRDFGKRIFSFALNRIHNESVAEEIVSDTLYEVWRKASTFRGDSQPSTWILGIARYKILTHIRNKLPDSEELDETMIDDGLTGFEHTLQLQAREHVQGCLDKINDLQRECVILVFYDGYSLAEIAEMQGCPEGTVKTRLFHARKGLKNCLEKIKDLMWQ